MYDLVEKLIKTVRRLFLYIKIVKISFQNELNQIIDLIKILTATFDTSGWKLVKAKLECTQLAVWGNKSRPF